MYQKFLSKNNTVINSQKNSGFAVLNNKMSREGSYCVRLKINKYKLSNTFCGGIIFGVIGLQNFKNHDFNHHELKNQIERLLNSNTMMTSTPTNSSEDPYIENP